ncbi:ATP-binding protein [Streptomyces chartreusis]|uniref:ATP-binding protein n=1 Tax=Streptomyces chartreusis TaxID=1969 RepID=UPI0036751ABE
MAASWGTYTADAMSGWWTAVAAGLTYFAVMIVVDRWAMRIANQLHRQRTEATALTKSWNQYFATLAEDSIKDLHTAAEQVSRGEKPTPPSNTQVAGGPWAELEIALRRSHTYAWHMVVSPRQSGADMSQVFVYLAGGLFTLVVRALEIVTAREATVEDPDTLYDLLDVDHLLRRIRRRAARFAVLGGQRARELDEPILLLHLLRGAIAEIERYDQVQLITPKVQVQIPAGNIGPDLIHLLAELIENATKFSPPQNQVTVKAGQVQAGLLIEITDKGLGLADEQIGYFNRLLVSPQEGDLEERLAEHQTGLLVAARLAARYRVKVKLERNFFDGTTALVLVPEGLLQQPGATPRPRAAVSPDARPTTGGPRPSPAVPGLASAALPSRRPQRTTATATPQAPSGAKPDLPQRQRQSPGASPSPAPAARTGVAPPDIEPGFAANFTAGVARAEQADDVPHPPAGSPPSGTDD